MHAEIGVEQNTEQNKIITAAVFSMKNVERFRRFTKSAICTAPLVKISFASVTLFRNVVQRRARRNWLPAVEVVGEYDLEELQYFHSSHSVSAKHILERRAEHYSFKN